jgi:hypothetical protein
MRKEDTNDYQNLNQQLYEAGGMNFYKNDESSSSFDDFDEVIEDIDFSEIEGPNFKSKLSKVNKKIDKKQKLKRSTKDFSIKRNTKITGSKDKKIGKVIVPQGRKVIVESVNDFILNQSPQGDSIKNLTNYNGEKLEQLVLTFNNSSSAVDFNIEIFNPSMMLDYLYSTSLNLNDKVTVAGGVTSYSDVLYNLLANPALLVNAKFVVAGPLVQQQLNIPLSVKNKTISGIQIIDPLNIQLQKDTMQFQNDIIFFNIYEQLNRPFIPDGMDILGYKVLPGMTVTMAFFYKQISLKKILFKEARESKKLL